MAVSKAQIVKLFPSAKTALVDAVVAGWPTAEAAGIDRPERIAQFLANIGTETGGLKAVEENMNYSAERIRAVWPSRFKSVAQATPYAGQPAKLANKVYGGRLGNTKADDGWRYRGRGMMQTTGRTNYAALGFEENPEALADPTVAFATAVREWKKRGCNALADKNDTTAIRRKINGGTHGLDQVKAYLNKARGIFAAYKPKADGPKADDVQTTSLTKGDNGKYVVDLQTNLTALGYEVPISGAFDEQTEKAVKDFQRANGLVVDGAAGIRTNTEIGNQLQKKETKPKLTAAKKVVNDAASKGKTISTTETLAALSGVGGGATVIKETVEATRDSAATVASLGPWILLGVVMMAAAGYIYYDRRNKRLEARDVQETMEQ